MFGKMVRMASAVGLGLAFLASAWGAGDAKDDKDLRPEKQPKVDAKQLESFQKGNPEIAELYESVQANIQELTSVLGQMADASARDKRKLEKQERSLRGDIGRDRRKLEKLLEKQIKPAEEIYLENKGKVDGYNEKAKKAQDAGEDKKAQKYAQEAAKYTGAMEGAKRKLDMLYYHTFFEGEEILKDAEKDGE